MLKWHRRVLLYSYCAAFRNVQLVEHLRQEVSVARWPSVLWVLMLGCCNVSVTSGRSFSTVHFVNVPYCVRYC
jgi:hypothetical protein